MEPEIQRNIEKERPRYQHPQQPPTKKTKPQILRDPFSDKSAAQVFCVGLGVILLVIGMAGFAIPNLWGGHFGPVHNFIHIVSGVISLWYGAGRSALSAKRFSQLMGGFYLLMGVVGLLLGAGNADAMWIAIPNVLEFGTTDHFLHIVVAAAFFLGSLLTLRKKSEFTLH